VWRSRLGAQEWKLFSPERASRHSSAKILPAGAGHLHRVRRDVQQLRARTFCGQRSSVTARFVLVSSVLAVLALRVAGRESNPRWCDLTCYPVLPPCTEVVEAYRSRSFLNFTTDSSANELTLSRAAVGDRVSSLTLRFPRQSSAVVRNLACNSLTALAHSRAAHPARALFLCYCASRVGFSSRVVVK
jgi:hypothetical protein